MANLKISQLEEYTGNPIGTYVVIDNATQDTTYKMLRRNFLLPNQEFSPSYGLYSQTGTSTPVSATTETSIINGGVGTLSVGANQFSIGDSFRAILGGELNAANNQTIRLRVKAGSAILGDTGVRTISQLTDNVFYFTLDFTVRNIGAAGVADIVTVGSFKYSKTSNGAVEGFAFNTVNNTTFDTTIDNTLSITAQWGAATSPNGIMTDIFTLTKIY